MKWITMLAALVLIAGCTRRAPLLEIRSALQPGMTQDEVAKIINGRGTLEKEFWCPSKHTWSERKAPKRRCPECGITDGVSELWCLFHSSSRALGAVYLRIGFDEHGKLTGTSFGDM